MPTRSCGISSRRTRGPARSSSSDYDGIYELYGGFGYAGSPKEAALRAFREGGIHFDLASLLYLHHLPELVEEGRLGEEELLVRAAEVLDVKERVGLLDDPFMGTAADRTQVLLAGPATAYRDLAKASVVLLRPTRPDPAVLPIPTEGVRLCVLGPLAHQDPEDWIGAYSSHANRHLERVTTPLAGIRRHWPDGGLRARLRLRLRRRRRRPAGGVRAAPGGGGGGPAGPGGDARRALPRRAAQVERGIGDAGGAAAAAGPAAARAEGAPGQPGAKLIVFVTAGRALHIPREVEENADAIFWTAHLGTFAGDAIADILAGVASPTARLSHGLPIADGITSGFDSRQARIDRPPVPVVPGSQARRQRHHWCAYYLGLGARWPAAYCFGEGYGYTSFELSDWSLSGRSLSASAGASITASVRVTNTGSRRGTETVHLYYQDMVCEERVPRLLERLGHRQATLDPGESATLSFTVTPEMLAKYGRDPDAGRRVWPDRNPAENPDRLFLVQHEGQALDAIERFGDAPCVLDVRAGAVGADDDDMGVSARRPEQHGQPRRRRRLLPWPDRVRFVTQEGRPFAPAAEIGSADGDVGPFQRPRSRWRSTIACSLA